MNVRQSWSRHGEEVKASAASLIEIVFVTLGCFSPIIIIMAVM